MSHDRNDIRLASHAAFHPDVLCRAFPRGVMNAAIFG